MDRRITTCSVVEWSTDGSRVIKTRSAAFDAGRRFRNELRVNRLLRASAPPVPTPRLLDHDRQRRSLTFAAVAGEPLGPKYPLELAPAHVDALVDVALRLQRFSPHRRWLIKSR